MLVPDLGFDRVSTMPKKRTADLCEREPPPQTKVGTYLEKSRSWSILQLFLSIFRQISSRNLSFLHYLGSIWTKAYFDLCSDFLSMRFLMKDTEKIRSKWETI